MLMMLMVLELGCRLSLGRSYLIRWPNLVLQQEADSINDLHGQYIYDPTLGYVPGPSFRSREVNYDDRGFRLTPAPPADAAAGAAILAAGDSFTEGDEVSDAETWPAYMPALVGRRTINAGVNGYGLDQTVLRTERQAALLRPSAIVVSFFADDLRRSEMSRMERPAKPYFTLDNVGTLVLHGVELPAAGLTYDRLTFLQRAFGWSILLQFTLQRLDEWDDWSSFVQRASPRGTGERLACPLMHRLAALAVPILVVAQYDRTIWEPGHATEQAEEHRQTALVLHCAETAGLATLDTFGVLEKTVHAQGIEALYGAWHHNASGNRLVAQVIAAELERRRMLP
ncbi:MAG: SGNH/GDSL hydrolase family protein [Reyranellales bacterium]